MAWGTTYLVTTELLPHGVWWWRSMVLGTLNIGAFFAFLFVAAYRLPGGVAATVGAIGPLVVGLLAARVLGEALTRRRLLAGVAGIIGVGLAKKWGQPERPLVTTSWQLIAGGALLLPLALLVEGLPREPLTWGNVA